MTCNSFDKKALVFALPGIAAIILASGCGSKSSVTDSPASSLLAFPPARESHIVRSLSASPASSSGPYHIDTYAYDDMYGQARAATSAQVNQLVTFAQGDAKSLDDCHSGTRTCKAVFYLRPYAEVSTNPSSCVEHPDADVLAAASESWFVHLSGYSDVAHRVWGKDLDGCIMYAMNPSSTAMQSWWKNYLQSKANTYDLFFVDQEPMDLKDATSFHSGGGCAPWPSYCASTQELPDDAAVVAAHESFIDSLTYTGGSMMHFFYQQAYPKRTETLDLSALGSTTSFVGVTCEGCITNTASIIEPVNYALYLNEMAAVIQAGKQFLIISDGDAAPGSSTEVLQRMATTGIVWLAYSEGHVVVQPNLERYTNNLAIWPEDLVYPSGPLQSMVAGAVDLQVAPGVWRREFSACYQMGRFFGRCAAVVNANSSAITVEKAWLSQTYAHAVSVSGGDVLSGGTASVSTTSFTPGVTTVQAGGGILLAQ